MIAKNGGKDNHGHEERAGALRETHPEADGPRALHVGGPRGQGRERVKGEGAICLKKFLRQVEGLRETERNAQYLTSLSLSLIYIDISTTKYECDIISEKCMIMLRIG